MPKLKNNTLQKFLENLIKELKDKNKKVSGDEWHGIDIPFVISSLRQDFQNNILGYNSFVEDLNAYPNYSITVTDSQNKYNGIIDVEVNLVKFIECGDNDFPDSESPNYSYKLCFSNEERNYGYCLCTPDMLDYREDKQCCGHRCDAEFCICSLYKVVHIATAKWNSDEHDYWEFEDKFWKEEKGDEVQKKEILDLKRRIEIDQKRLAELEEREKLQN